MARDMEIPRLSTMSLPICRAASTLLVAAILGAPRIVTAQRNEPGASSLPVAACSYSGCALAIAPRWNGLAVVRGAAGPRVANLSFFWPRDVAVALRGDATNSASADSATLEARRAMQLRRVGAALTDGGIVLTAAAVAGALKAGHLRRSDSILAAAGAASLAVSIPFQFAADGALSRAVWWHNLRFAR